jgi:hypothetical protein
MGELERQLIRKAKKKHNTIFPCARKRSFSTSFTRADDRLLFWYNTHDSSTHVVSARVKPATRHKLSVAV